MNDITLLVGIMAISIFVTIKWWLDPTKTKKSKIFILFEEVAVLLFGLSYYLLVVQGIGLFGPIGFTAFIIAGILLILARQSERKVPG